MFSQKERSRLSNFSAWKFSRQNCIASSPCFPVVSFPILAMEKQKKEFLISVEKDTAEELVQIVKRFV